MYEAFCEPPDFRLFRLWDTGVEMPVSSKVQSLAGIRDILRGGPVEIRRAKGDWVPAHVVQLLDEILSNLELGNAVSVVARDRAISTREAAELLGVSRPHVVHLLETGEIPFHKVGSHRRLFPKDVLAYRKSRDRRRRAALNRMAKMELAAGTYDALVLPETSLE